MEHLKRHLDEVLEKDLTVIERTTSGSPERKKLVDDFKELYELRIEEKRIELEHLKEDNRATDQERSSEMKLIEISHSRHDTIIRVLADIGIAGAGMLAYDRWFRRGLLFERTGSVGSPWVKGLITKMIPKK